MLRDYQVAARQECDAGWSTPGVANIMLTLATGGGKTVVVGDTLKTYNVASVVMAHRQELVGQLALSLNREAVPHAIIAPKAIVREIIAFEMDAHGFTHYSPRSNIRVAAVDTLIRRDPKKDAWFEDVQLQIVDEGHHVLRTNKWGQAMAMFPNARGLLVTAHAVRGDGMGLGRHADGVVDRLVIGPHGRELISRGMLVDYDFACPKNDLRLENVEIGANNEFNTKQVRAAVHASTRIVGDVVGAYLEHARDKLGITFAVDIESATEIADKYKERGVHAEIITGETPLGVRSALMRQFRNRQIQQLVSVDVLGEGVDVPGVEVISMARPTNSFQLFGQQLGRGLRLNISNELTAQWHAFSNVERLAHIARSVKPKTLFIDHVQNTLRHGLPDVKQVYKLERREKRSRKQPDDAIPMRECVKCLKPYQRTELKCPYCGEEFIPAGRSTPDQVDGDIGLLDPAVLETWRAELSRVDGAARVSQYGNTAAGPTIVRNHMNRQIAQQSLRAAMALYAGLMIHDGYSEREAYKRFYFMFGYDVMNAQTLGTPDANALEAKIKIFLDRRNVIEAAA